MSRSLSTQEVQELIGSGESLRVEFKSERREPLSDHQGRCHGAMHYHRAAGQQAASSVDR